MKVRLAIPNKGRLYDPTLQLLKRAGFSLIDRDERMLISKSSDPDVEFIFSRAEDIPKLIESEAVDLGITGHDLVVESGAKVTEILDLDFGRAKVVLATPVSSELDSVDEVKDGARVATKFVNLAIDYFNRRGRRVNIIKIAGATEVTPYLGLADLIIDLMSSGATLTIHGLKVLDILLESSARLIVNDRSYVEKKLKISEVALALESVLLAEKKKLIMMNVPEKFLKAVVEVLPAMAGPTIAKVESPEPMWEVYSVIDESEVHKVVSMVKQAGARDILVIPIERIIK